MFEKIVQRLSTTPVDENSDLIGLIDLIEFELDFSTGNKSMRSRLLKAIGDLDDPNGKDHRCVVEILRDAANRLEKIEKYMQQYGFKTARETSKDDSP